MILTDLDKQIAEEFRKNPSYAQVARKVGRSRPTVERHILTMRAGGVELPPLKKRVLSPERARLIGKLGGKAARAKNK